MSPPRRDAGDLLLAVDVGNTSASFGLFDGQTLLRAWHAPHDAAPQTTADPSARLTAALRDIGEERGASTAGGAPRVGAVVYCSVSPTREAALMARLNLPETADAPLPRVAVTPGQTRVSVTMAPYPPDQLGPDRLVNLCAARAQYPNRPVLVADFGTATTFDFLLADGRFAGGAIAPGLQTFWDCLPPKTARLPAVEIAPAQGARGVSTRECLQSGLVHGYLGMTRGVLAAILADSTDGDGPPPIAIATGGWAQTVQQLADAPLFDRIDPRLTLRGLAQIYALNAG